jgi:hypothetical protein
MKKISTIIGIGALLVAAIPAFAGNYQPQRPQMPDLKAGANVVLVSTTSHATAGTGENVQFNMVMPQKEEHHDRRGGSTPVVGATLWSGDASAISGASTVVGVQENTIGCGCETQPTCCRGERDRQSQSGISLGVNLVAVRTASTANAYTGRNMQTNMGATGDLLSGNAFAQSGAETVVGAQVNGLN